MVDATAAAVPPEAGSSVPAASPQAPLPRAEPASPSTRTRSRVPSLAEAGPSSLRRDSAPPSPVTPRRRSRPSWWTDEHEAAQPRSTEATPAPTAAASQPPKPQYLQPWAFYPLNNHRGAGPITEPIPVPEGEILSPEDDRQATRGIPIFRPSMEEFADFEGYASRTTAWGQYSGITKIIPPDEWTQTLPPLDKRQLTDVRIKMPIQQNMIGKSGVFVQANVQKMKNKPMTIEQWFQKCRDKQFVAPSPKEADLTVDRDSKEARERRAALKAQMEADKLAKRAKRDAAAARKRERELRESETPAKPKSEDAGEGVGPGPVADSAIATDADSAPPLDHDSHSSPEAMPKTPEADAVDPFFNDIDLRRAWLPKDASPEDYTVEACARLERRFWKNLGVGEPSWYGADLQGTLFPDRDTPWNVANLPNLLNRPGLRTLPGVNSPYLYFGMWRAAFSWHVEDMDLFSINYIHFGAPKFWYAVPQQQAEQFERVVAGYFPNDAARCDQFMRHKSCTISPMSLAKDGIRVNMLVHNQNEFVITYPRGYHAGFNLGFNCAESINFALDSWIELGRRAKACECVDFSVRIDVDALLAEQNLVDVIEQERADRKEASGDNSPANGDSASASRKRKRSKADALSVKAEITDAETTSTPATPAKSKAPVVRPRKPKATVEVSEPDRPPTIARPKPTFPCLFCPSSDESDLAPIVDASDVVRARSKSKDPNLRGHVSCALAIPELYLDESEQDGVQRTLICGPDYVQKDRWGLKCGLCNNKQSAMMGLKIQCTKGACAKAYHVSCAQASELVYLSVTDRVEQQPTSMPEGANGDADALEYEDVTITDVVLLCPQHNPAVKEMKQRRAQEELRQRVYALQPDELVKFRQGGSSWSAPFMRVLEDTQQIEVRMLYTSTVVDWKSLDFRPAETRVIENEYAGPPKRSRKEAANGQPAPAPLRATDIANLVHPGTQPFVPYAHNGFHTATAAGVPVHTYDRVHIVDAKPPAHDGWASAGWDAGMVAAAPGRWTQPIVRAGPVAQYQRAPFVPFTRPLGAHPSHISHGHAPATPYQATSGTSTSIPPFSNGPPQRPAPAASGVGKIDLGLERMAKFMQLFPPLRVPAIHLAGTNGKGSVSAILESCLRAAGLRTARYNSPHLVEPRDAVRIDGVPVAAALHASALDRVQQAAAANAIEPTVFEVATAAAYLLFNEAGVDVMIIECGMGGARDATNVIPPGAVLAAGLTAVGLDHTDFLGTTIAAITAEKVGIVPAGCTLVIAPNQVPDAVSTATAIAAQRGFRLVEALPSSSRHASAALSLQPFSPPPPALVSTPLPLVFNSPSISTGVQPSIETELNLPGAHQVDNLSLALTLLHVVRYDRRALAIQPKLANLADAAIKHGVAAARWEGRCSWLQWRPRGAPFAFYPVLVDGAHNADSAARLRAYVDNLGQAGPTTYVLALSHSPSRPPGAVLAPLLRAGDRVAAVDFATPVAGMPWVRPAERAAVLRVAAALVGQQGETHDAGATGATGAAALDAALAWATAPYGSGAPPGLVVVCGSLYLVADAYRLMGR